MKQTINRYNIYKYYLSIKEKLLKSEYIFAPTLLKWLSGLKDLGIELHYIYVTKIKFFLRSSLTKNVQERYIEQIQVSPKNIEFISGDVKVNEKKKPFFLGGNWDRPNVKIEDTDTFIVINENIVNRGVFENSLNFEAKGNLVGTPLTEKQQIVGLEFDHLLSKFITYLSHNNNLFEKINNSDQLYEDIEVNIGRNGQLLLVSGLLKLAIAKTLNVEKINAKVNIRHTGWVRFRKRFETLVKGVGSKAYQPPMHPDLQYIQADQSCAERLKMIRDNTQKKGGSLLDLGANIGYFSINFEDEGFDCTAVEYFPNYVFGLLGQKKALNKKFTVINGSFLDSKVIRDYPFDIVLALNVFSHLLVHKETFAKLDSFLDHLKCKELFFEPYSPNDPQMANAYINIDEDQFAEYLRFKLNLKSIEIIGTASDKRKMYKIS